MKSTETFKRTIEDYLKERIVSIIEKNKEKLIL